MVETIVAIGLNGRVARRRGVDDAVLAPPKSSM